MPNPVDPAGRRAHLLIGLVVFFATVFLVAYPPTQALLELGSLGAFKYFSHDSFYYLSIAENSRGLDFFSFDGQYPTNGFHPLWGVFLVEAAEHFGLDGAELLRFASLWSIWMAAMGLGLFAYAVWLWTGRAAVAVLATVPGFFWMLMPSIKFQAGSPWSFANGMESPMSIGLLGGLCFVLWAFYGGRLPSDRKGLLVLSSLLALITLARLDDVFMVAVFAGAPLLERKRPVRERLERCVWIGALPALLVSGYMLYNLAYAGSLLPSSGMAKSRPFWAFARNSYATWTTLFPGLDFMRENPKYWTGEAWRVVQMLVPALVAATWLWRRVSVVGVDGLGTRDTKQVVDLLAAYVIAKASYNFTMVSLWAQGDWYYPISIMVTNLIVALWIAEVLDALVTRSPKEPSGPLVHLPVKSLAVIGAIAFALLQANTFSEKMEHGSYQERTHQFWSEREETRAALDELCRGCGVLAYEDGVVSFSLHPTPTLNGIGLVSDRAASEAIQSGRLLELAWERGYRFLASVSYAMVEEAYTDPVSLREHLLRNPHFKHEHMESWNFEVAYRAKRSGIAFVRFEPRSDMQLSTLH